jgi:hypothetical protein
MFSWQAVSVTNNSLNSRQPKSGPRLTLTVAVCRGPNLDDKEKSRESALWSASRYGSSETPRCQASEPEVAELFKSEV